MTPVEAEIKLMAVVMDVAMQLYVADIHKTPTDQLGQIRPLNKIAADYYVDEAIILYNAAFPRVRNLIKR